MPWSKQFKGNKEAYNEYFREYRKKRRKKFREYNKKYNSEYRKKHGYKNEETWHKSHKLEIKAQRAVRYRVKTGQIIKKPCVICKYKEVVAHHPDYSKPLDVIWLCKIHHRKYHYKGYLSPISTG